MSDTKVTPSDGTRTQRTDALLALLGELLAGQEGNTEILASLGRDVHAILTEQTGAIRSFGDAHGHRGAAEESILRELKFLRQDIGLCRHEVQNVQAALNEIRSRVAGIELWAEGNRDRVEGLEARISAVEGAPTEDEPNGNGHA